DAVLVLLDPETAALQRGADGGAWLAGGRLAVAEVEGVGEEECAARAEDTGRLVQRRLQAGDVDHVAAANRVEQALRERQRGAVPSAHLGGPRPGNRERPLLFLTPPDAQKVRPLPLRTVEHGAARQEDGQEGEVHPEDGLEGGGDPGHETSAPAAGVKRHVP